MTKLLYGVIILIFLSACNQTKQDERQAAQTKVSAAATKPTQQDSIETVANSVLQALKEKNYTSFASFFHPIDGVRFSPYGFIDPTHKRVLAKDFLEAIAKNWTLTWGHFDGSGEAIKMKVRPYINRFVYNADYLKAEQKDFDNFIG